MALTRSVLISLGTAFILMGHVAYADSTKPLVEDAIVVAEKYSVMEGALLYLFKLKIRGF